MRKNHLFLLLTFLLILGACCPKEGVDRSSHNNSYNVTLELTNQTSRNPISFLDGESKVSIMYTNGARQDSKSFSQSSNPSNQFTFYFDENTNESDIGALELRLIDYKNTVLDFKTSPKTTFQREPIVLAKNEAGNIFCRWSIIDLILPQANAMSCRTKEGSKLTWRSGYLFKLNLLPEEP